VESDVVIVEPYRQPPVPVTDPVLFRRLVKAAFSQRRKQLANSLRALCGDAEVTPIHPFTLSQRVSETDAIREGLYVFEPQALGPHCRSVRLGLHSEKEPEKEDTRTVAPPVIERIWQDFAPYRARVATSGDGRPL